MNFKKQIIKFSKKLNSTNLSALRSGNISARAREKGVDGFYITPSGMKYSSLKPNDIVFVTLDGRFEKNKKPSTPFSLALAEIFPDLKADKLVELSFLENLMICFFNFII